MKNFIILLLLCLPFLGNAQKQSKDFISISDLQEYMEQETQDTIGFGFVVKREEGKEDVVLQIFRSEYRQLINQQVNYLPDAYPFTEGACWDYLKFRYKVYTHENNSIPLTGYTECKPIVEKIPYPKNLEGFIKYLENKGSK